LGQQWRVVIAQLRAEPGETAGQAVRLDCKLQDEQQLPVDVVPEHDCRNGAIARADLALPGGEPIEGLEDGAVGPLLERLPLVPDRLEVAVDAQVDAGTRDRLRWTRGGDAERRARRQRQLLLSVRLDLFDAPCGRNTVRAGIEAPLALADGGV